MKDFPIGVMLDSFRLPFEEAVAKAREVGAEGVQIYAVSGFFTPDNLTGDKRAYVRKVLDDAGLKVSALCGDFGGKGFTDPAENPKRIEASEKIIDLALDLGSNIVTTHIGAVPADDTCERYSIMQDACSKLAGYANAHGAYFAIETGPEPAPRLKKFLDSLPCKGVAVNMDPANLVMVQKEDPVEAVHTLKDYIVHTHAKDGVQLRPCDPEKIYGGGKWPDENGLTVDDYFQEVPLGKGNVHFPTYLDALRDIGYHGYLTIERETGDDPAKDIADAVKFLQAL